MSISGILDALDPVFSVVIEAGNRSDLLAEFYFRIRACCDEDLAYSSCFSKLDSSDGDS